LSYCPFSAASLFSWRLRFLIQGADVMSAYQHEATKNRRRTSRSLSLRIVARQLLALMLAALCVAGSYVGIASASTFTTTVPGTAITLPSTYPQAGGVVIVLEGVNGNVYYQFVNPTTMFQGYQNSGAPAAWQGNPFQIGPVMSLNCGPILSCSTYLGGGVTRMSVRFTAYDGDNQAGMFDANDLNLRINGQNFGANNGNWTSVPTQNTDVTGATVISSNTGFGNNTFDTGWFQSTDPGILNSVLSTGNITATVFDRDANDNFWDFRRGNDAVTSVVPLNVAPGVTIDKASTTTAFTTVGQIIPYTFTIRNIGSVWINSVQVSDPKITSVTCPAPPAAVTANLDPGEQIVCTGNYSVKQIDVDAGVINNTATATGTPQAGALGPVTDTNSIAGPAAAPSFDFTKTATPAATFGVVGSTVTYSFAIRNTGNVTLSNAVITDPLLPALSCSVPAVAPGATANATCTGNLLTVTQAHVDAGTIANTASVALKTPAGATLNKTSAVTLSGPARVRSLTVDKESPTANFTAIGGSVSYTYLVRNTGNVTLTGVVSVADDKVAVSCPPLPALGLAPNSTHSCTANYTVTQADLDTGAVVNNATATIGSTTSPTDRVSVPAVQTRSLTLDKTSTTGNYTAVGNVLSYSYVLRNTGNVTLTGAVSVTDNKTIVSCPAFPSAGLSPNGTHTCSASYTVTQADIDAGSVVNTANASIGATAAPSDQVTIPAIKSPSLSVVKNATSVNFVNVGDVVQYEYIVTNTGNTTLTAPITVADNRVATVNCPALPSGGLVPGAAHVCTASYAIKIEDLDIGSVTNLASASSGPVTSPQTSRTIPSGANPALSIDKTSPATTFNSVGDVVAYEFKVRNSGNATFTRLINVTDDKIGTLACYTPSAGNPTLIPLEEVTCAANYTVTQADIDRGFVTNQAFAATTYGAANVPVTSPPDSVTLNAVQNPELTVTKTATTLPISAVGQVLTYTIRVANTGDTTLTGITVTDPLIPTLSCSIAKLNPAASNTSCVGTYTVKQADFDAGKIENTATASGSTPQGIAVSDTGVLNTPITQNSSLTLAKIYAGNTDDDGSNSVSLNDTLNYTVTATNNGNITQTDVVVTDAKLTPSSKTCAAVAPRATCILTGTLKVSQAEVDAGTVANTAEVVSAKITTPLTAARSVPVPRISSLATDKTFVSNADGDTSSSITLSDVLTYAVAVSNTGNVTQTNVVVTDAQLSPNTANCATLAPGAQCVLTGTKTVTQAEVDQGYINNTGSAVSTFVTRPVADTVQIPVAQTSSATIAKVITSNADQDGSSTISLNDTLTYNVTATNTGTVTLGGVEVTDTMLSPGVKYCLNVAPGATCVLSGIITVTQAQVNAGRIDNIASVKSIELQTPITTALSTPVPQVRSINLDKQRRTTNYNSVGNLISYDYVIRNTGNVTLAGLVNVTDDKTSVTCPPLPSAGLAPNATHTCTSTYTIAQADLDAGSVVNNASATLGTLGPVNDQETVPAVQSPALAIDKTSSTPSFDAVGDVISYQYVLRNTGNVTLTGAVAVADDKTSVSCGPLPAAGLAPSATLNCTASYTVTQRDVDAGDVVNIASATIGTTTSPTDTVSVPGVQIPSMRIEKKATAVNFTSIGDRVEYEYTVFNTGNTTLVDEIKVIDNRVSPVVCEPMPAAGVAPGEKLICRATYRVVIDDLAIGTVTNLAYATSGAITSPQTSETIPSGRNPALSIVKTAGASSFTAEGEEIEYKFVVTNSGDATFTNEIEVYDDKIGRLGCFRPDAGDLTFEPREEVTCTARYIVSQADVDAGFVTNQAYASTFYGRDNIPVTSPPADVTVDAAQNPLMSVSKRGVRGILSPGEPIVYEFTVRNLGNVTLSEINVVDPLIPTLYCSIPSIGPGGLNNTCRGTYYITQADMDRGRIDNTATATAVTPQGVGLTESGQTQVPLPQVSQLFVSKTFAYNSDENGSGDASLGETLTYSVQARNTGTVTQTNVVVTDPLLTPSSITCASVAPGYICGLVGTLTVTQAHVDAGEVVNTGSAVSTLIPQPQTQTHNLPVGQLPSIAISKSLSSNADEDQSNSITAGDTLTYLVVATNDGNVTQTNVTVNDPKIAPSSVVCPSVAPGDTCILSGTLRVSQDDVDAGIISNTGSVATDLIPSLASNTVDTPVAQTSSLAIVKALTSNADEDASTTVSLNDTLTYTVTVTNDGTITQNNVEVSDAQLTPSSRICAKLLPGQNCVLSGTLQVTQMDVDAGRVINTAGVTSTLLPTSETARATTNIPQSPALTLDKSSTATPYAAVGDELAYSYLVTNSGNVTLTGAVTVTDDRATVVCPALPGGTLAPGGTVTCTATYEVTQADLDAGSVVNTASAALAGVRSPDDLVTVNADQKPKLELEKTSPTPSFDAVGDVITYDYVIRNTGNVTLIGPVGVNDDKTSVVCPDMAGPGFAPQETMSCSATYTVTQADLDAGAVTNIASGFVDAVASPIVQLSVPAVKNPAMTVEKKAVSGTTFTAVGDIVSYEYIVTNTGNVTLTDAITVTDNLVSTVNCPVLPAEGLAPQATLTCTADYAVTLGDLDLGVITNLASSKSGATTSDPVSATVPTGSSPALTVEKASTAASFSAVGDVVPYEFKLTNSGQATFTRLINIVDDKIGTIACFSPTATDLTFAPGETQICTANYTVTQADLDAGKVTNNAYASTTYGATNSPVTSAPDRLTIDAVLAPALAVTKSSSQPRLNAANQVLPYTITVENTGNVTVNGIVVTDPLIPSLNCTIASLAPGASDNSCVGSYTVTQADFDRGTVTNTATASGTTLLGTEVTGSGALQTISYSANPAITIDKNASVLSFTAVGQVIDYTFTARNTGNLTLTDINVTDSLVPAFSCVIPSLAPGDSDSSCQTSYTVQQSDIDAGNIINTASVSATPARGRPPTNTDTVGVNGPARLAGLTVDKTAQETSFALVDDIIHYSFVVTNTGNISVFGPVTINDPKLAGISCQSVPATGLLPGQSVLCDGSYTVTQADLDAGKIENSATASAMTVLGPLTSPADEVTVDAVISPSVTVVKRANTVSVNFGTNNAVTDAGDRIGYTFEISNTGNLTFASVSISDAKVTGVSCPTGPLAPGLSAVCTATYTLTTADIDAGSVTNTATGLGTLLSGQSVSDISGTAANNDAPTVTPLTSLPLITLIKSAAAPTTASGLNPTVTDAGDSIAYTFTVENTGNTTLSSIAIIDPQVGTVTCAATLLPAGGTTSCSATYVLKQLDIDAGSVTNSATVRANPPTGPPITDISGSTGTNDTPTTSNITRAPAIALVKTASPVNDLDGNGPDAGDTIAYTFTVSNPGTVTLSNVTIDDPLVMAAAETSTTPLNMLAKLDQIDLTTTASLRVSPATDVETANAIATPRADVPPVATQLHATRRLVRLDKSTAPLKAGDQLGVVFYITNTGEAPLGNVSVLQVTSLGLGEPLTLLAPNQTDKTNFVFVHTLTEAEIAAGAFTVPAEVKAFSRNTPVSVGVTSELQLASAQVLDDVLTASITPANVVSLAPGASVTFDGLYTLKQSDVDAGRVTNTATARADAPGGVRVSDISDDDSAASGASDPTVSIIVGTPAMELVKTAGTPSTGLGANTAVTDAGDAIEYTFAVENTGALTLNGISIADPQIANVTCPTASVAPGNMINCTGTYTILQSDIDAGEVVNTATVSADNLSAGVPSGNAKGNTDPTVSTLAPAPAITLVKTAGVPTTALGSNADLTDVDDEIAYSFVVTNTGTVTLSAIDIIDAKISGITCPTASLLPQVSTTCTGTYVLKIEDMNAGSVSNTARVTAQSLGGEVSDNSGTAGSNDDPTVTAIAQTSAIALVKTAGPIVDTDSNGIDVGDTIDYTFTVTNLGNTALSNVSINDPLVPVTGGVLASLAPGASDATTFKATYALTLDDLNRGTVSNSAEVSGTPPATLANPSPAPVTDTSDDDSTAPGAGDATVVDIPQAAAVGLVKRSGGVTDLDGNGPDVGDTIAYTFEVTNSGNVTLTNIRVTDVLVAVVGGPIATLAPGSVDATTFTATYTLTQDDIDKGQLVNTANVLATSPQGDDVTDVSDDGTAGSAANDPTVTSITQTPDIRLVKLADSTAVSNPPAIGDIITYRFTVANRGTVTMTDVSIADALPGIVLAGGPLLELKPGEVDTTTFTARYALKAADIANGGVSNSAVVTGTYKDVGGIDRTETDTSGTTEDNDTATEVPLVAAPDVSLVKTAVFNDVASPNGGSVGDTITYTFVVANGGNLPLTNIAIDDPKLAGVTCPATTLAVGARMTCTAPAYAISADDLATGSVSNQATVEANTLSGALLSDESGTAGTNDNPTVTRFPVPRASFTKSASVATAKIGETVSFTLSASDVAFAPATIVDTLPAGLTYVPGSAKANGVAVEPAIAGRNLTFSGLTSTGGNISLTLRAVVNASARNGSLVNKAQLLLSDGSVLARAQAKIEIRPEPVFDCGDVIGKVFNDANGNGIQDAETSPYEPERGLPGVRVATVNGELITTDKFGRFHIGCADIPDARIGSNFILKVDARSLPAGYRLTTENPRVVRLTRGKLTKINFGASISNVVRINLSDKAFTGGDAVVTPKLRAAVAKLLDVLDKDPSVLRLNYQVGSRGRDVAQRRLDAVASYIRQQWKQGGHSAKLPIETRLTDVQETKQ
jgi:uncharacterized repeat protein (TIGR01451 family)